MLPGFGLLRASKVPDKASSRQFDSSATSGSSADTLSVRPRSDSSPLVMPNHSFNPNPLRCFVQTCRSCTSASSRLSWQRVGLTQSVRPHVQVQPHPKDRISGALTCLRILGSRSEEHTSELQSLMRISYAVFCLKKKNNILHNTT